MISNVTSRIQRLLDTLLFFFIFFSPRWFRQLCKCNVPVSIPQIKVTQWSNALWARTTKNADWNTGPLARSLVRSFARSLAPLTSLLVPHYSLCPRTPLRSLACSLTHYAHSLARGTVNDRMAIYSVFFSQCNEEIMSSQSQSVWNSRSW